MPTVLEFEGFFVRIYLNDHQPAHVHVVKNGSKAKIALGIGGATPQLIEVSDQMKHSDVKKSLELVIKYNEELLEKWRTIHE